MPFSLALRNVIKNKKDTSVVAGFIAVITFLFFIGNTITGIADRNIRRTYIESLTGDVVLQKTGDVTMNLFGANTPVIDSFFAIPVLPSYYTLMDILSAEDAIEGITSQVSGNVFMDLLDLREPVLLCGVDAASYFPLFPGIVLEQGRHLQAGEYGAMITSDRALRAARQSGQYPQIGTPVLLTSGGDMGFKIREVPLVGIFHYQNPGLFMNEIVIADSQTVRMLNSIQAAGLVEEDDIQFNLLNMDIDDIFGAAFAFVDEQPEIEFSVDMLQGFLSAPGNETSGTGGDWNFIIIRLKKNRSAGAFISSLNKKIEGYGVVAVNWRIASGTSAILSLLVQALYNFGMFLVSAAGIIAIVNILLISIFLRVREIGTLRAVGASDGYIRSMIYWESIIIALAAGIAGIVLGAVLLRWVNSLNINISNEIVGSIMDGSELRLEFLPNVAVLSILAALFVGIAAAVYPVEKAVRLEPIAAVRRG